MKRLVLAVMAVGLVGVARAGFFPQFDVSGSTVVVTGSLTATTGGLTDTELRASGIPTTEVSISTVGTPTTVSISTSAWTKVPATSSLANRNGILLSVPATLTANVVGILDGCTSTAVATTVRPMEYAKGNGFTLVPVNNDICLWLLSIHTAAESVHVQEVKQ